MLQPQVLLVRDRRDQILPDQQPVGIGMCQELQIGLLLPAAVFDMANLFLYCQCKFFPVQWLEQIIAYPIFYRTLGVVKIFVPTQQDHVRWRFLFLVDFASSSPSITGIRMSLMIRSMWN